MTAFRWRLRSWEEDSKILKSFSPGIGRPASNLWPESWARCPLSSSPNEKDTLWGVFQGIMALRCGFTICTGRDFDHNDLTPCPPAQNCQKHVADNSHPPYMSHHGIQSLFMLLPPQESTKLKTGQEILVIPFYRQKCWGLRTAVAPLPPLHTLLFRQVLNRPTGIQRIGLTEWASLKEKRSLPCKILVQWSRAAWATRDRGPGSEVVGLSHGHEGPISEESDQRSSPVLWKKKN